jgi:hypothetical protein
MLAGTVPSSEYLIESRVLDSTVASVTFSNLSQYAGVYKHLQIVALGRSSVAAANMGYRIRFNGGTSNDYSFHRILGNGSNVSAYADAVPTYFYITAGVIGAPGTANAYGAAVIDILDAFSTNKNKTIRTLSSAQSQIALDGVGWFDTAAIDSLVIESDWATPDLLAGSRFSIYGVTA